MKAKKPLIIGCIAAAAALAAGCGSSGSSSSSSTSAAATAASTTPATPGSRYGAGGASNNASTSSHAVVVSVKQSKDGTILAAGPKHMTVYLFEGDKGGQSACSGACAQAWPPVTTSGQPQGSGSADSSKLGTITRADGTTQATYNGHPLYLFVKDKDAGDAYGQGVKAFGADWYVVAPSGDKVDNDEAGHSGGGGSAS